MKKIFVVSYSPTYFVYRVKYAFTSLSEANQFIADQPEDGNWWQVEEIDLKDNND
jgi:hypothetical protein